jgi:hypothetical protein
MVAVVVLGSRPAAVTAACKLCSLAVLVTSLDAVTITYGKKS